MGERYGLNSKIDNLTDDEIYDAIRYLDPDPTGTTQDKVDAGVVICVSLWILVLGCLGFMLLSW
jgi:hypothetical protein